MTHEQFTFWLRGFLEDKKTLTQKDMEVIKLQMTQVYSNDTIYINPGISPINHDYLTPPYVVTCGAGSSTVQNTFTL